mmetsp:Transcript_1432/g.6271  ORF Transcript_1432/g.6271 Transcript_1432/m.6271 type:complete len:519 (-) Transcript_1432:803-2359(-)
MLPVVVRDSRAMGALLEVPDRTDELWLCDTVFNLLSATLGAGTLMYPYGFANAGLVPATVLLLVGGVATVASIRFIVLGCAECQAHSLDELALKASGPRMEQAVQAGIIIFSLSAGTIYLLRASELLVQLCNAFDFALSADEAHILFGIICFVLSSAKQVYSIRTISMCSVLSVFYLVGLSIVHCSLRLTTQEVAFDDHLRRENVNLFYGSMTGILKAFPMMIFAFAAQMAVPSILDGMSQEYRHRKIERMLFAKRKRVARALVIRRGQIFGSTDAPPKRKGNKFRLFGKKAAAKALSPSLLQDNLSSVRKDELQRLGGASVQQLAKAKLETLDPQQMTSLRARGPKRMTRAQIVFLSQCSLETLTFRELELLAHLPLESFSNEELAEATKNPVQAAMRFDRSLVVRPTEMGQGAVSAVPPEIRRRVPGSTKPTETSNPALLTLPNDQVSPLPAAMPGLPAEAKVESFESVSMIAVAVGTFVNLAVGEENPTAFLMATLSAFPPKFQMACSCCRAFSS